MDFTGVNAGKLSFDWSSVNNSTGDRKGSLRVYYSTDGSTFTELTTAQVLNFTNNIVTYGSISNITLPTAFNNAATARLRFYYHNGTGGSTGSRPKVSIDNVTVTATSTTPCAAPTSQPTSLSFSSVLSNSITGSFTAASSTPDRYLVLLSNSSSLGELPVNGTVYNVGDNIGDASVVSLSASTTFTANSLSASTTYYFYVFSFNQQCSGGPLYLTASPLTASTTTATDLVVCAVPSAQPTGLTFSNKTATSIQGSFTAAAADEYLVIRHTAASLSASPSNGTTYNPGDAVGGGIVVSRSSLTSFNASPLSASTTYYFFIYSITSQNCTGGPIYNTASPLTGSAATLSAFSSVCATPVYQPGNLVTTSNNSSISGSFSNAPDADGYLVLYSTSASLSQNPVNNTDYTFGTTIGNATVGASTSSNNFYIPNLSASTTYYLFVLQKQWLQWRYKI